MEEKEKSEKIDEKTEFEKAVENGPDELLNIMAIHYTEGVIPFIREAEALIEINNLQEKDRKEAYKLLTQKDKTEFVYKYSPTKVLEFFNNQEE